MPSSRKKVNPAAFQPAAVDPRPPLDQEWEPNLLFGERVQVLNVAPDELQPDLMPDPHNDVEDTGPGSASLAAQFEPLPIEWITGEPAVETLRFELSDGLRYVGELAEEDGGSGSSEEEHDSEDGVETYFGEDDSDGQSSDGVALGLLDENPEGLDGDGDALAVAAHELAEHDETPGLDNDAARRAEAGGVSQADFLAAIEAARAEALREGYEHGHAQGLAEGLSQGVEQGRGLGRDEARQQLEADLDGRQRELGELINSIRSAATDSHRLFAPLKRLAVHLAEQLVRGELSLSGDAINRLVEHALMEIDHSPGNELVLSLNPEDLERWKRMSPAAFDSLELRTDPSLSIGSVRVTAGESIIEDLIEHRLHQMAARLLGEVPAKGFSRLTSIRMSGGIPEDISDVG